MPSGLPPVVGVLRGDVGGFIAKMAEAKGAMASTSSGFTGLAGGAGIAAVAIGGALVAGLAVSIKMAGDFQSKMTGLVTGAGETAANINMVSGGLLGMASEVGVSASQLADGMYMVESAGFHGAAGLQVMKVAAEGAKVGNADMATVANALTSALNAYHLPASNATAVTNDLIATVAAGKMHMQDLAGAMGTVLPEAAALHVGLADVTGAIATMTMQGTDAATAATGLRFLMSSLANETPKGKKALEQFGLSAKDVGTELTTKGLQATLATITEAVGKKFPEGSSQYIASVAAIVGGTRGLNTTLELSGSNMKTWRDNVVGITGAVKNGGTAVQGWSQVQGDFNFKMDQAKAGLGSMAIALGQQLLPYATQFLNWLTPMIPALEEFAVNLLIGKVIPGIQGLVKWFGTLLPTAKALYDHFAKEMSPAIQDIFAHSGRLVPILQAVGIVIAGVVLAVIQVVSWGIQMADAILKAQDAFLKWYDAGMKSLNNVLIPMAKWVGNVAREFEGLIGSAGRAAGAVSKIPGIGAAAHALHIPGFAAGGIVPGSPGSPQLILAHGGEMVLNQAQQAAGGGGNTTHAVFHIYEATDAEHVAQVVNARLASAMS